MGKFDCVRLWNIAKQLGVTFSCEEGEIIKYLENMEDRDGKHGRTSVGEQTVAHENN